VWQLHPPLPSAGCPTASLRRLNIVHYQLFEELPVNGTQVGPKITDLVHQTNEVSFESQ
jgi:hypothetical protein